MRFGWILTGTMAATLGAVLWALLTSATGYEIGWVAWGVGALVGMGVGMSSKQQQGGWLPAIGASILAIGGIAGGKYASIWLELDALKTQIREDVVPDDMLVSYIADEIVAEREQAGIAVDWPDGSESSTEGVGPADYPADVWNEAAEAWAAKSIEQQDEFRREIQSNASDALNAVPLWSVLSESVSGFDALWIFLAVSTAARMGYGAGSGASSKVASIGRPETVTAPLTGGFLNRAAPSNGAVRPIPPATAEALKGMSTLPSSPSPLGTQPTVFRPDAMGPSTKA